MGRDCVTSDLVPRLAWGVGHRNAAERRVRCCSCQWGAFKWKTFLCIVWIINLPSHFFKFCYKYLITKLEKNKLDMMNVTPSAGYSWGASWAYKDTTK